MGKNSETPVLMVTMGMFGLVVGGFLTVMHVGEMARQNNEIQYGFSFREGQPADKNAPASAASRPGGFAADLELGGKVITSKASGLANALFSWMDKNPQSGGGYASAQRPPDAPDSSAQGDPFADFYNRNYGASSGGQASYGGGFSGAFGGSVAAMRPPGSDGLNGKRAWHGTGLERAAAKAAALQRQAQAGQPLFGGPVDRYAAKVPPMQASLPSGGSPVTSGVRAPSAGLPASYPAAGGRPAGALNAMRGGGAAVSLNGAGEGAASASTGNFDMKMSMGAGGVGGTSGGGRSAAPDASPAAAADGGADGGAPGGDSSSSGSGGGSFSSMSSGPSLAQSPDKAAAKTSSATSDSGGGEDQGTFFWGGGATQPFLRTVALERRSGANSKYLAEADYSSSPDRAMLRAGAVLQDKKTQPANTRLLMMSQAPEPQDPEKFSALSQARKTELKKEIFSFLRRFENKYGGMSDITYTSCNDAVELCEKNGLTEGYLTEVTVKKAAIQLALKYSDKRWSPYTISVVMPKD